MTGKSVVRGSACSSQIPFQAKPGTASGTSVIYGKEAPELQIRRLGDLFFMLKLYKQAYNCYHTAKKDFQVRSLFIQILKPWFYFIIYRLFDKLCLLNFVSTV